MNVAAALSGGMNPNSNPNNPLVKKRMESQRQDASERKEESAGTNFDGSMNHFAYDNKPTLAPSVRKTAQTKKANAFFSDSDEDESPIQQQSYPVQPAQQ